MMIEPVKQHDLDECIDLISRTFDRFVAGDCTEKGIRTFYGFLEKEAMKKRIESGNIIICAKQDNRVVALQEVRNKSHIALFFVDQTFQGKGIGRQLFKYVLQETKIKHPEITEMTVNSSSYAEKIYEQLGFKRTGDIQEKDGIRHIPMKYAIQEFQLEKQE